MMFETLDSLSNELQLPKNWLEKETKLGYLPHLLIDGKLFFIKRQVLEKLCIIAEQTSRVTRFMSTDFSERNET